MRLGRHKLRHGLDEEYAVRFGLAVRIGECSWVSGVGGDRRRLGVGGKEGDGGTIEARKENHLDILRQCGLGVETPRQPQQGLIKGGAGGTW
jgi:hypothetical protein